MKERPILFSGPMVRAIREGRKTQTRRIVKPQPQFEFHGVPFVRAHDMGESPQTINCPHGQPGDWLWVKETWGLHARGDVTDWAVRGDDITLDRWEIQYRCDWGPAQEGCFWRPSIHMPRWASRITLEIVSVRVERLQDITEDDAKAEGADFGFWHPEQGVFAEPTDEEDEQNSCFRDGYGFLWESINGPGSWDLNPWVWVIEFKEVKP